MLRSIVGQTSNECNEVSVSSQRAEHLQASDSSQRAEQPPSEDSVKHYRQSDSSERAERDRSSFDNITDIERPPRSRGESPTSIDINESQQYRDRSQSSKTYSRGRSRHWKRTNREFDRHRSRDRRSRHRSPERTHHRSSRSDGHHRSRRRDSPDESRRHRHSPARSQVRDDRNERSVGSFRSSDRNAENYFDQSRRDNDQINRQPLFVDYDSTPIQGVTSNLPSTRLEVNSTVQTVTSIRSVDSTTQSVRLEEPTLESGTTPTVENNSLVFSSQPYNTICYERADSKIKISQKSTRLHVLHGIANLNSVYHSYHHGEVIHPDFVLTFVNNLQLHYMSDSALRASCVDWKDWEREFFITKLQALYPQNPDAIDKTFLQAIKDW